MGSRMTMPVLRGKPTELRFNVLAFADITPNPLFDRNTCQPWQASDATLLHHRPNAAILLSLFILLLLLHTFSFHFIHTLTTPLFNLWTSSFSLHMFYFFNISTAFRAASVVVYATFGYGFYNNDGNPRMNQEFWDKMF